MSHKVKMCVWWFVRTQGWREEQKTVKERERENEGESCLAKGRERFSQVPGVVQDFLCAECDCLKWLPEECF